jgi:hypothetical protein
MIGYWHIYLAFTGIIQEKVPESEKDLAGWRGFPLT